MPKSYVAGIVSKDGHSYRTVVTENKDDFARYHVAEGERLFILPDARVQEPVDVFTAGVVADGVRDYIRSVDSTLLQSQPLAVAAVGPTKAGGAASNNTTNLSFSPSVAIPQGAFAVLAAISDIPDTAAVTVTDQNGNVWERLVGSQQPGTQTTLWVYWSLITTAIPTNRNISIDVPNGSQIAAGLLFYTGAVGNVNSITVQWDNTTTPSVSVPAKAGSECLALMGVNGPPGDNFTQDPNGWGADIGAGGVGANQYRLHGGSKEITLDATATYAPILGTARQVVTAVMVFN